MTEISFYHLQKTPLEKTLPRLLEKIYAAGMRSVVLIDTEERLKALDNQLWTYTPQAFLPHGGKGDPYPEEQPVWLTTTLENPNEASVLVVTDGEEIADFMSFDKCLDLFNGHDENAVSQARARWKRYSQEEHKLTYWFQEDTGGWKRKEDTL